MKHVIWKSLCLGFLICLSTCPSHAIHIVWDYTSIKQLAKSGGYARILRLQDHSLVAVYTDDKGFALIRSCNDGKVWSKPVYPFKQFKYTNKKGESTLVNIANAEIIQLKNGNLVVACNYRPIKSEIEPYTIAICRSLDNGKTWTKAKEIYHAAARFIDGCWEPSFLQLPDGQLQVYFANEYPYQKSDEQQISMLSSKNNGETWTPTMTTISFRAGHRDGMPVARIVGNEIVVTIEDNGHDRFKPYTVRTALSDPWSRPVYADSPQRDYALVDQLDSTLYLGAPYLLKLPTGETLISYQTTEGRMDNWELSTMEVAIGDKEARHFEKRTRPFDIPTNKAGLWNSIALWNDSTVVAVTSSNFGSNEFAPYMILGHIVPD